MVSDMASRQRGDLGGRLGRGWVPARVTIRLDADVARTACGQHLTWMLVNLLARQADEISALDLVVPPGIPVARPLSPFVQVGPDVASALRAGIGLINPRVLQPAANQQSHVSIRVGPGTLDEADLALATTAVGWAAYVGQEPVDIVGQDDNPIGAYLAACLAAGETFKHIRSMRPDAGAFAERLWFDAFALRLSAAPPAPRLLPATIALPPTILAGVGAVGSAFLHTLYATPGLGGELTLIDNDPDGIDITNLNRYVLFGLPHIGCPKASTAAALVDHGRLVIQPFDGSWQEWRMQNQGHALPLVVSAVDKNVARHAIQDALPRLTLGASTDSMRAQVNVYDPGHGGPCLRCRNRSEAAVPDDVVIERLRQLAPGERATEAKNVGIAPPVLDAFLADPHAQCGLVSGAALQKFRGGSDEVQWTVGFVSALAGVALAAAYLARCIDPASAALDAQRNTFRFQFWRPNNAAANTTTATPPEQACVCQDAVFQRALALAHGGSP